MRTIEYAPKQTPREWGRAHGETHRGPIRDLAEIRLELACTVGRMQARSAVLEAASAHLAVLRRFDERLYDELLGIADGADTTPERVVVLNHYTDLRDLKPDWAASHTADEGCTAVFARTPDGPLLGETWDMHGSATDYVAALHVPADSDQPEAWLLTIVGCLGMSGMNSQGLGVVINNLWSLDARVGVVWPALVRRLLRESRADVARDLVLGAPLGSGHHYLVADEERCYGVETSGQRRGVVFDGRADWFVHTNHCFDTRVSEVSAVSPTSTTRERFSAMRGALEERPLAGADELWSHFSSHDGYPRSICTHLATPEQPHAVATCGAILMKLRERQVWMHQGCLQQGETAPFELGRG